MKTISLLIAIFGLLTSSGRINVAFAKSALEALQDSAPPPRHRCPDPGGPVPEKVAADINEQIWAGLYEKSEKLGGLTLIEVDPDSRKPLAEHQFVVSPIEKKVYLYDYQYQLASKGSTVTLCTTNRNGKKPNWGRRTVTSADGKETEAEFSKKRPDMVRFLRVEKLFWIRHADALRNEATEAEVEYAVRP